MFWGSMDLCSSFNKTDRCGFFFSETSISLQPWLSCNSRPGWLNSEMNSNGVTTAWCRGFFVFFFFIFYIYVFIHFPPTCHSCRAHLQQLVLPTFMFIWSHLVCKPLPKNASKTPTWGQASVHSSDVRTKIVAFLKRAFFFFLEVPQMVLE